MSFVERLRDGTYHFQPYPDTLDGEVAFYKSVEIKRAKRPPYQAGLAKVFCLGVHLRESASVLVGVPRYWRVSRSFLVPYKRFLDNLDEDIMNQILDINSPRPIFYVENNVRGGACTFKQTSKLFKSPPPECLLPLNQMEIYY